LYGWPNNLTNHYFIQDRTISNVWEDLRGVKTEYKDGYTYINFAGFKVKINGKVDGEVIRKKQLTDIWRFNKPTISAEHPTMKPVELVSEAIINSSQENDIVLDPFLGSGSTLIACEKTNRICRGIELDPKYMDVIIQRYENYAGNKAIKINNPN
jgi:DNA modification methylase